MTKTKKKKQTEKESLWEISQKRIYLGCVREEMEELQKKAA